MKFLKVFLFLHIFIQILNINSFSQTDSIPVSSFDLINIRNDKTITIHEGDNITVYLTSKTQIRSNIEGIGDTYLILNDSLVSFSEITKLKYHSDLITDLKTAGYAIAGTSVGLIGLGYLLVFVGHDNSVMPFKSILGVMIGFTVLVISPLSIMMLVPYRTFNIEKNWSINEG